MAIINTLNFLPEIFKTDPNQKFLNATLDQLIAEPVLQKINGYIGRTFAPTFKSGDSYIIEADPARQSYQLEPGVVVTDANNEVQFYNNYVDLINKIEYYGGKSSAHSRLFENETYTFNGRVEFDKLVNFSQYYWLPNGPTVVDVYAGAIEKTKTFDVTRNDKVGAYQFTGTGIANNPDIVLARGGTYQFIVNQNGAYDDGAVSPKFWIQTSTGTDGQSQYHANISSRDIHGVTNNGISQGVVTFQVPQANGQDEFVSMPIVRVVDLATTSRFVDIDNQLLSNVAELIGGIDGVTALGSLLGKYLIFVNNDIVDTAWDEKGVYALHGWGIDPYDEGQLVPNNKRTGIWKIEITDTGDGDQLINLAWDQDIPHGHKVVIKSGEQYADSEFFKDPNGVLSKVPVLTAPLETLYYNDGTNQQYSGRIRIVENSSFSIDIEQDILNKDQYTSPNGVVFTNGLKIRFDSMVVPASYANNLYYVEGVGTSIRLVAEEALATPELNYGTDSIPFDIYGFDSTAFDQILSGPLTADYITINRSSIDCNAWSRSNRWFHEEVITAASAYNDEVPKLDSKARAARPIIEFEPDLQLFNNGKIAYTGVDVLDFTITDAFTQVEGPIGDFYNTAGLEDGMSIIFANDFDPQVKNKVFVVRIITIGTELRVHLEANETLVQEFDSVVPLLETIVTLVPYTSGDPALEYNPSSRRVAIPEHLNSETMLTGVIGPNTGIIQGSTFWFTGSDWKEGQVKLSVNVPPEFDIVDSAGHSFGDTAHYVNSSFSGSKVFSYKPATGKADPVLGFPLSYRNFNNIGDIEFVNNVDTDSFSYLLNKVNQTDKVNKGYISRIINRTTYTPLNVWDARTEPSKQYQIISNTYDGTTTFFEIDILPEPVKLIPNLKVFINSKIKPASSYAITTLGVQFVLNVTAPMVAGDQVDILIYSKSVSKLGYYEIPPALELNSLNATFSSLTLGQFRNHLSTIVNNSTEVVGQVPGSSNLRDLNIKARGGSILQHSAPSIYSSLFLTNDKLNFIDSATLAQREYTRFKNRFLELYTSVINDSITDPALGVDHIMAQLNAVKNKKSPWYYSDMIPYDSNRTLINYTVLNETITEYEIDQIFNDSILSNKAVLVYVNGEQLLKGEDYTFNQTRPSILFSIPLTYNDQIEIQIFNNTDGCFVPETPTKLGLYPKFKPELFLDTTYQKPIDVIRGHDGSVTPTFGDIRDQLLLELETRIYNNIKVNYNTSNFDINDHIPGKFRDTNYSRAEFDQVLSRYFLNWVGSNRIDFNSNSWYTASNPWSWTYSNMPDKIDGEMLPGYWRGIYRYFYDTDEPNKHPWEMLGFSEMPDWWIDTYGPAPYTGGNMVLWSDLEQGIIRAGQFAGTNPIYARPGLTTVIPVTESGELKSPDQFIVAAFNLLDTNLSFVLGDEGPVEAAWRRSSEYPFAIQQTIALMAPGLYFGQLLDPQQYNNNNALGQYVFSSTNQRRTPDDVVINGETKGSSINRAAGYLNWVADYLTHNNLDPVTTLRSYLNNVDVRLGYKVAGFTDKAYLTLLAEQSSPTSTNDSIIIPNENYKVFLNKSTPVDRIVYSGVIVEKTATGYAVSGYDLHNPFFTIVPSEPNSNQRSVVVGTDSGIVYQDYRKIKVTVPYGYELNNKQQVVDFLISYGRFLQSQGFVFDEFNQDLQSVSDWELAVKEFLTWTQQGWSAGNIIVLSPFSNSVKVIYDGAVVDEVVNLPAGSKVIDTNFNVVKNNLFNVVRSDSLFTLTMVDGLSIGLIDLSLVQFEHVLIFDNQTVFNDIIYKPELGNRQYRLKVIGNKTGNWAGQVNPPGFIYSNPVINNWSSGQDYRKGDLVLYKNLIYTALDVVTASDSFVFGYWQQIDKKSIKTGLLPNLATNAVKFQNMYDVDNQISDQNINSFSNGLIGYRSRSYLDDLSLNATTQTKFYQGYIRDKGTKDAITALSSGIFNNLSGALTYNEEWAFRVGEYGALNSNRYVEVQLSDNKYVSDPIAITILNPGEQTQESGIVVENKDTLYKKSTSFTPTIFANRTESSDYTNDIQTAGYVNLNDIDTTVFDIRKIQDLNSTISQMFDGYKIWVAKDSSRQWGVYRVDSVTANLLNAMYSLDGLATFTTDNPHGLVVNDNFVVRNFSAEVDGVYKVTRVDSPTTMLVTITTALETVMTTMPSLSSHGTLFKLSSVRFDTLSDVADYVPKHGWKSTDKVWIDTDTTGWGVYSKITPWNFSTELIGSSINTSSHYGQAIGVSPDGNIIAVTAPGNYENNIDLIIKDSEGNYIATGTVLVPHTPNVVVGNMLAMNQTDIIVSATNHTAPGHVLAYVLSVEHFVVDLLDQYNIVDTTSIPDSGYGTSVAVSTNGNWLFVSAPAAGMIQCYEKNVVTGRFVWSSNVIGATGIKFGQVITTNSDGSLLVVGSPNTSATGGILKAGSVSVYSRTGTAFTSLQTLLVSSPQLYEEFGTSVCLVNEGAELLVGATGKSDTNYSAGVVYRYKFNGTIYQLAQTIKKPFNNFAERFGTVIAVDTESNSLFITSDGAYSLNGTMIDSEFYTLDAGATQFIDSIRDAGAVYVYDLISDAYCYSQELGDANVSIGEEFGTSLATYKGIVFVGTPNADTFSLDAGKIALFQNPLLESGWKKMRYEQPKVDLDMVTNLYLYDRKSETILSHLDYIDPAKGKILGTAEEELTYKTSFDPAKYNLGSNTKTSIDSTYYWGSNQVGQLWWNMDLVRYVDYEQDNLSYRIANWGKLFTGSTIEICEWVASDYLPYQYKGDGVPKYADNSAYAQEILVDPVTGVIRPKYYFWVINKSTFDPSLKARRVSALTVANLIESPIAQDIPYAALLQNNSIALFNSKSFIASDKTILHVDYAVLRNTNIIHNEYELVRENTADAIVPAKIVNKMIDSLTGADLFGNSVPDYNLKVSERYGILIRPRQTMFANRLVATQNFVRYANSVFLKTPVVVEFNLSKLYLIDPVPTSVTIIENQIPVTYLIDLTVDTTEERSYINPDSISEGQFVLTLQDSDFDNQWAVYRVQADKSFAVHSTQGYRTTDYWSKVDWFDTTYDPTVKPTYTVETLKDMDPLTLKSQDVVWVKNDGSGRFSVYRANDDLTTSLIGIQEGTIQLSDSLWAHDTHQIGFGNDNFDITKFDLNPTIEFRNIINAIKDDIFTNILDGEFNNLFFILLDYLFTEQRLVDWAFKSSYISIIHKLRKLSQFPNYIKDNQTFYESYINEVKPYRTKIREYLINYEGDDAGDIHPTDFDLPSYYDADFGIWRSPNGEHARDALLLATNPQYADWLANHTFYFDSVQVVKSGYGYSSAPMLTVEGGGGTGTVLEADIDMYTGSITRVRVVKPGTGFTSTPVIRVFGDGIDDSGNQTLVCYPVLTNTTIRTINTTIKFDRIEYAAEIRVWESNAHYNTVEIIAHEGRVYRAKEDHTSNTYFDPSLYNQIDASELDCAQDRALAFYRPGPGQTPNDPKQLFLGAEYPGVLVDGANYIESTNVELDTQLESYYTDMVTGTRPEDVNIEGGAYIDTFSSHAPEEMLPGMTFDTLDIRVFTVNPADPTNNPMGYRISKTMAKETTTAFDVVKYINGIGFPLSTLTAEDDVVQIVVKTTFDGVTGVTTFDTPSAPWEFRRISAASTTTLAQDLFIADIEIFVDDASVLPAPSPTLAQPGVVYINGEKITYYTVNLTTNSLGQIRRGVWGTGAPAIHAVGSLVVDASVEQKLPGDAANTTWLNPSPTPGYGVTDQNGLFASNEEQAVFIRLQPTYLPWAPGQTGIHIDPNAYKTRFDDDGTPPGSGTIHGYDIDPLDSYSAG